MNDYKPNSHKYKEEQKAAEERPRQEKIVSGTVKTKKKSELSKLSDVFISEDAHNVKSYILMDVLVPAVKKAISDIVTNGIDMILYGSTGRDRKKGSAGYVSYNKYSDRDRSDSRRVTTTSSRYSLDDVIFETRGDAEAVLDRMCEIIEESGCVTVAELYDISDLAEKIQYTDHKYGWTNIRNAEAIRVRDGYMLKLPKIIPI